MAQKKTNYNRELIPAIHRPRTKTGYALYTKVADFSGKGEGAATQAEADEIYKRECQSKFNSPTNIRRVFITYDTIRVDYYNGPNLENSGTNNLANFDKISIRHLEHPIRNVISEMLQNEQRMREYMQEKVVNKGAKEPDMYSIDGDVIGVLSSPYTCNNVEEVYVDWSPLLSDEVKPYFQQFASIEAINAFMSRNYNPQEIKNEMMLKYFTAFNSGGVKDIKTRFPRLRIVGLISNLEEVIRSCPDKLNKMSMFPVAKAGENSVGDYVENRFPTWYSLAKQAGLLESSLCLISPVQVQLPNYNFVIKDSQYKYDRDILKSAVDVHIARIKDYIRTKQYGKKEDDEENAETSANENEQMGELEIELIKIRDTYDEQALKLVLLASTHGMKRTELENIFKGFTKANRNSIAKLIGLDIK